MANFHQNLLGGYGKKAFFYKLCFQLKYLSYLQVVFVLTQISVIFTDNFNDKYL